jgi:hypothetical protein
MVCSTFLLAFSLPPCLRVPKDITHWSWHLLARSVFIYFGRQLNFHSHFPPRTVSINDVAAEFISTWGIYCALARSVQVIFLYAYGNQIV